MDFNSLADVPRGYIMQLNDTFLNNGDWRIGTAEEGKAERKLLKIADKFPWGRDNMFKRLEAQEAERATGWQDFIKYLQARGLDVVRGPELKFLLDATVKCVEYILAGGGLEKSYDRVYKETGIDLDPDKKTLRFERGMVMAGKSIVMAVIGFFSGGPVGLFLGLMAPAMNEAKKQKAIAAANEQNKLAHGYAVDRVVVDAAQYFKTEEQLKAATAGLSGSPLFIVGIIIFVFVFIKKRRK